jgi:hypothetical protein
LAFGTISDPLLAAALWLSVGALALTMLLLVAIAAMRIGLLRRHGRERDAAERWNPLLAECTERVPAVLPPLSRRETELFLALWCKVQESLRGEAQERLREMARRLEVAPLALKMLNSFRARRRLLALVTLGHLRESGAVPALLGLLPGAPAVVSMAAAHALLRIDAALGAPRILAATAVRKDWALAKVASMLMECAPGTIGPFLSAAIGVELRAQREADPGRAGLARLLRLHACVEGGALRQAVLKVMDQASDVEPLIAALAALSHPGDAAHARRLLDHTDWAVRAAAARALERLGTPEDFQRLCVALGDRNWWVRYRAAHALCALPQANAQDLRALPARLSDAFAADMLRHALAERGAA